MKDLRSGLSFVWKLRGLRYLIFIAAVVNFFATMAFMLFLPFFQKNPDLGPVKYGIAMAVLTGGMFLNLVLLTAVKVPPSKRFLLFQVCGVTSFGSMIAFPFIHSFPVAAVILAVSGFTNAGVNVFINSVMQLAVPQDMRGKVFSLMTMATLGLTPVALGLAGALAEFIPTPLIIGGCFLVTFFAGMPSMFLGSFRRFINFRPRQGHGAEHSIDFSLPSCWRPILPSWR